MPVALPFDDPMPDMAAGGRGGRGGGRKALIGQSRHLSLQVTTSISHCSI